MFVIYVIVMCSIFYEAERRRRLTTLAPAHLPVRATQRLNDDILWAESAPAALLGGAAVDNKHPLAFGHRPDDRDTLLVQLRC